MVQDGDEKDIAALLGISAKAIERSRAKIPIPRRRTPVNRVQSASTVPILRLASRVALGRVNASDNGAREHQPAVREEKIMGGSGSACSDDRNYTSPLHTSWTSFHSGSISKQHVTRRAPPANIKQNFRAFKSTPSKSAAENGSAKSPIKCTYRRNPPIQIPHPTPKRRDIYDFEDDRPGATISIVPEAAETQEQEYSSLGRDSGESQESPADEEMSLLRASSPMLRKETSQESLTSEERIAERHRTRIIATLNIQRAFAEETAYGGASSRLAQVSNFQRSPTGPNINHRIEERARLGTPKAQESRAVVVEYEDNQAVEDQGKVKDDDLDQQEPLDELDHEILNLGRDDILVSTTTKHRNQAQERQRTSPKKDNLYRPPDNSGDEEVEEDLTPAMKKRRLSLKNPKVGVRNTALKEIGERRASRGVARAMNDVGDRRRSNGNTPERLAKKKKTIPRKFPVNELATTTEKMTASDTDDGPRELSQDPISQTEGYQRPQKVPNLRLKFPSRSCIGSINIEQFRFPKPQRNGVRSRKALYNDGFEGDEAKPTKFYMPIKQSNQRRKIFDKSVIRIPTLTIVAERPCSEEPGDQPRRRVKKKSRRTNVEHGVTPPEEHVQNFVANGEESIVLNDQLMHEEDMQYLEDDAESLQRYKPPKMVCPKIDETGERQIGQDAASQSELARSPRPATNASQVPQTPVSKDPQVDHRRSSRKGLQAVIAGEDDEKEENLDTVSPSKLRISQSHGASPKPKQPVSTKQIIQIQKDSIQVFQETSLVRVSRRTKYIDESESESESEESHRNHSGSEDDDKTDRDDDEFGPEESSEEEIEAAPGLVACQNARQDRLPVVPPEKAMASVNEKAKAASVDQQGLETEGEAENSQRKSTQEAEAMPMNEEEIVEEGGKLDPQLARENEKELVDEDEDPHPQYDLETQIVPENGIDASLVVEDDLDTQEGTQDNRMTQINTQEVADELIELTATQLNEITLVNGQMLADEEGIARREPTSVSQPATGKIFRVPAIPTALKFSFFSPTSTPHQTGNARRGRSQSLAVSHPQREPQQSYIDSQDAWKPQIPKGIDMSSTEDGIIDTPTRALPQTKASNRHSQGLRRRSAIGSQSLTLAASKQQSLVRGNTEAILRESQPDFLVTQASRESQTSVPYPSQPPPAFRSQAPATLPRPPTMKRTQFEDQQDELKTPETSIMVVEEPDYFSSISRSLSGISATRCATADFRTKSSPAYASNPCFMPSSEPVFIPLSDNLQNTVYSPPKPSPRHRHLSLLHTPSQSGSQNSQKTLSEITRQASQNLGTLSGSSLRASQKRSRMPSLLKHLPPFKK